MVPLVVIFSGTCKQEVKLVPTSNLVPAKILVPPSDLVPALRLVPASKWVPAMYLVPTWDQGLRSKRISAFRLVPTKSGTRIKVRGIYSSNGTGFFPPVRYPGYQFSSLIFPPFNRHFTLKIEISSPDPPNNYFLLHFWAIISPKI